jgi:hypothetical protein
MTVDLEDNEAVLIIQLLNQYVVKNSMTDDTAREVQLLRKMVAAQEAHYSAKRLGSSQVRVGVQITGGLDNEET